MRGLTDQNAPERALLRLALPSPKAIDRKRCRVGIDRSCMVLAQPDSIVRRLALFPLHGGVIPRTIGCCSTDVRRNPNAEFAVARKVRTDGVATAKWRRAEPTGAFADLVLHLLSEIISAAVRHRRRFYAWTAPVDEGTSAVRESFEHSVYFRAMPVYDLQFTGVDLKTGDEHGPYDSWEYVALAMAFSRLPPGRVEVLTDAPAIAGIAEVGNALGVLAGVVASRVIDCDQRPAFNQLAPFERDSVLRRWTVRYDANRGRQVPSPMIAIAMVTVATGAPTASAVIRLALSSECRGPRWVAPGDSSMRTEMAWMLWSTPPGGT